MYLRSGKTTNDLKLNYLKYLIKSKSKYKDSKNITVTNFIVILEFIIDNKGLLKNSESFKSSILSKIKLYKDKHNELEQYYQQIDSIPIY